MSGAALVLLSVLGSLVLAVAGCYALHSVLVMVGRTALWLEDNRWVYPAGLAAGLGIVAAGVLSVLPLVPLGLAVVVVSTGRYVWLNV